MNQFWRKNLGLIVVVFMAFLPVWRWLTIAPISPRFSGLGLTTNSLGQMAGLIGITLFAINLILASRLKIFDRLFNGLGNLYYWHRHLGIISFCLLLFHPLFLVVKYLLISTQSAALFFLPFQNLATTLGGVALDLMMVLIILTLYVKLKYQTWKFSHKFMVAVFAFAWLHVSLIPSDVSRDGWLRFYILGLGFLGLAAGLYQTFFKTFFNRFFSRNFAYVIKKITPLNATIIEVEIEPKDQIIKFKPGQFVFIRFLGGNVKKEIHPFSMVSAPSERNLKFIIKNLGDYTSTLKNLAIGNPVLVEGPFGSFSHLNAKRKNQIWLAGGVGVTPFISMAKSLSPDYQIDLYYSVRNREEAVRLKELSEIASANQNFKLIPWLADEQGFITGEIVASASGGLGGKDILICGPEVFADAMIDQFLKLGVKRKNIHFEKFKFL